MTRYADYSSVEQTSGKIIAQREVSVGGAKLAVHDVWNSAGDSISLERRLVVEGDSDKAFLSAVEFEFAGHTRQQTEYFVPGRSMGVPTT